MPEWDPDEPRDDVRREFRRSYLERAALDEAMILSWAVSQIALDLRIYWAAFLDQVQPG